MKPEDVVVSLEIAKELKENGYPQHSIFRLVEILEKGETQNWHLITPDEQPRDYAYISGDVVNQVIAAPTATEIFNQLPDIEIGKTNSMYVVRFYELHIEKQFDQTLTGALAKMWLYLKKNNLLGKETL